MIYSILTQDTLMDASKSDDSGQNNVKKSGTISGVHIFYWG
jgi:hypothetical protein